MPISLCGFNQNQSGFTPDGVPLGSTTRGNVNGLHVSRATSVPLRSVRIRPRKPVTGILSSHCGTFVSATFHPRKVTLGRASFSVAG